MTGDLDSATPPFAFMPVGVPDGLVPLGDLEIDSPTTLGVGSYLAQNIREGAGSPRDRQRGRPRDALRHRRVPRRGFHARRDRLDPPRSSPIHLAAGALARFRDGAGFFGVVYGPEADVLVEKGGEFAGGFVGGRVELKDEARVLYDEALHRNVRPSDPPALDLSSTLEVVPGRLLAMPVALVDLLEYQVRIAGRTLPLMNLLGTLNVVVPADLPVGSEVEISLVDAAGADAAPETFMVPVAPPAACGLLGIEFLLSSRWPVRCGACGAPEIARYLRIASALQKARRGGRRGLSASKRMTSMSRGGGPRRRCRIVPSIGKAASPPATRIGPRQLEAHLPRWRRGTRRWILASMPRWERRPDRVLDAGVVGVERRPSASASPAVISFNVAPSGGSRISSGVAMAENSGTFPAHVRSCALAPPPEPLPRDAPVVPAAADGVHGRGHLGADRHRRHLLRQGVPGTVRRIPCGARVLGRHCRGR